MLIHINEYVFMLFEVILIFITSIVLCHKWLETNGYFTLKMESDVHDSFITPINHENKKAAVY